MTFHKPPLTVEQQLDLLIQRGMIVTDRQSAIHSLSHINYYRLRAYWLPFEIVDRSEEMHFFKPNTHFNAIVAIYDFDRKLRLLLLDAIERFETSLRASLANTLALHDGAFAHEQVQNFNKPHQWQQSLSKLNKEYLRSHETFAEHFRKQHPSLATPPIWVSSELMAFGHLSSWLQNIRIPKVRQTIADYYHLDEKVLTSFAHHLSIVRNYCAHHGRIWNRKFSFTMQIPGKKPSGLALMFNHAQKNNLYNTLTMLAYLLDIISPGAAWKQKVITLINASSTIIDPCQMGFPNDWQTKAIWQGVSL